MNEIVAIGKTVVGDVEIKTVDGRALHVFLEVKQQFSNWIQGRIDRYGFAEGVDFITIKNSIYSPPRIDYHLSIVMAKELSMVERTEKGKQARQYFIECEKKALMPKPLLPGNYKEALIELVAKIEENERLEAVVAAQTPKVEFYDSIKSSQRLYSFSEVAKLISNNGQFTIGRTVLMAMLRGLGWLFAKENEPMQKAVDNGWLKSDPVSVAPGIVVKQTKVTADGLEYIIPPVQRALINKGLKGKVKLVDVEKIVKMIPEQRRKYLAEKRRQAKAFA